MDWQKLLSTIPQLFDLLEQREIEYALVGGVAVLVYVTGRNTQDPARRLPACGAVRA